ncbi:MAG: RNA polymerase sigma-54 factor, partial [Armatimonadota bacterium]
AELAAETAAMGRAMLREILAGEPATRPLTDDQIQSALHEEGYEIARRTVNKYRRALGIPSSTERRRIYTAA